MLATEMLAIEASATTSWCTLDPPGERVPEKTLVTIGETIEPVGSVGLPHPAADRNAATIAKPGTASLRAITKCRVIRE
jgi:hypothetical protein